MPGMMTGAERSLAGSLVSIPVQTEQTLGFSHLFQALQVTELTPPEQVNEARTRLREREARYRIVLTINQGN